MFNKLKKHLPVLVIFILSFPPLLWWFKSGHVIDGSDIFFSIMPNNSLRKTFYVWDSTVDVGKSSMVRSPMQIYLALLSLLQFIGFNSHWQTKILYFLIVFLTGLGMYFFARSIFKNNKRTFALISASFYMYNLYFLQQITDFAVVVGYVFIPYLLFLFLRALDSGKILFYAAVFSLLTIFIPPINPSSFLPMIIFVVFYILYSVAISKSEPKKIAKFVFFVIFISFLVNFRIIYPYFAFLSSSGAGIKGNLVDWVSGVSKNTSFFNVVRLIGAWDWFEKWYFEDYVPYGQIYLSNKIFIVLSFIPPLFAFLGFFLKKNKQTLFFFAISLLGIFLAMGAHMPTGSLFLWLYKNIPLFWMFRSPWYKFSFWIAFAYSILIGFFSQYLLQKVKKRRLLSFICPAILISLFILIALPLFTGSRFITKEDRKGYLSAIQVEYPEYIYKVADYFNNDEELNRIILSPQFIYQSTAFEWGYGRTAPVLLHDLIEEKGIVVLPFDAKAIPANYVNNIKESFYSNNTQRVANYLAFLNVAYVLAQEDFNYKSGGVESYADKIGNFWNKQSDIKLEKKIGKWKIYSNSNYLSRIYSTQRLLLVSKLSDIEVVPLINGQNIAFINQNKANIDPVSLVPFKANKYYLPEFQASANRFQYTFKLTDTSKIGFYNSFLVSNSKFPVYVDGKLIDLTDSDEMVLNQGNHQVVIHASFTNNILNDSLIEQKVGTQKVWQIAPLEDGYYKISFEYKNIKDEQLKLLIEEQDAGVTYNKRFPNSTVWRNKSFIFRPRGRADLFNLYISPVEKGSVAESLIRNIKVNRVLTNVEGFYTRTIIPKVDSKTSLDFFRLNPTEYSVRVYAQKPFFLIFNEAFDKNWALITDDGEKERIADHFLVNAYGNGYYVKKTGSYKLKLIHSQQKNMNLGNYISLLSILVVLLFLLL